MNIATITGCLPCASSLDMHVTFERSTSMWTLLREKTVQPWGRFLTKVEALGEGTKQARHLGVQLIEHGRNGQIQRATNYSAWRGPCELCD